MLLQTQLYFLGIADAVEKQGLEPIMEIIDANGGWPIIMDSAGRNMDNFTWQKIDNIYNQMFGGSSFFQIKYQTDTNSSRHKLSVSFYLRFYLRKCFTNVLIICSCPHQLSILNFPLFLLIRKKCLIVIRYILEIITITIMIYFHKVIFQILHIPLYTYAEAN